MSLLTVSHLGIKAGGVPLVKDVSFTIEKGEMLALVGESGSGKTLTALSLLQLLPEAVRMQGDIRFERGRGPVVGGRQKSSSSPESRHPAPLLRGLDAGMIFQEPMTSLNPLHTIGKQVAEAIHIHQRGLGKNEVRTRVMELLEKVGLSTFKGRLDAYPHQLSGGERQRVMIAMAIANDPELLIADEPTTALDVTVQAQILALLQELRARTNMAMLLITHDLPLVKRIADRIAIMSKGEIVEMGKTADIFARPQHPYTLHLLSSEPGKNPASGPATEVFLECRNLSASYAGPAKLFSSGKSTPPVLQDINLTVRRGTTLGVVGESGSGKTTLALAILRLVKCSGRIVLGGQPIDTLSGSTLRRLRREMQIVFQDPYSSLNPRMLVGGIIREGLDLHEPHLPEAERKARLEAILREVGLEPSAKDRYPHEFSGGQRQRISIARALILNPKLLILDEPTSALDLSVQAQILELLRMLQEKHGLTYIFISHDLRVVRAISHSILMLKQGKVVEEGEAAQIFDRPQQDYTRGLIKAAML